MTRLPGDSSATSRWFLQDTGAVRVEYAPGLSLPTLTSKGKGQKLESVLCMLLLLSVTQKGCAGTSIHFTGVCAQHLHVKASA